MLYDQDMVWTGHPSKSLGYLPLTTGKGSELAVPRLAVYFSFAAEDLPFTEIETATNELT